MAELGQLPLTRDIDGQLHLAGTGPVTLQIHYGQILGTGGEGVVFKGVLINIRDGSLAIEVALKMHRHVEDPHGSLRREAEMHAKAWARLNHVLKPYGFLAAHEATDTPAILVMEIGVRFRQFLEQAGPPHTRQLHWARAIARVTDQLLRFIVAGDATKLMHKDIKLENIFVSNAHDLELAELAVGDFGGAQNGIAMVSQIEQKK